MRVSARNFLRRGEGQTIVETIVVLPFFLLFVFALLQAGQLAVTLVTVNYAAGSIARKAVQRDQASATQDDRTHLQDLMFGGMTAQGVSIQQVNGGASQNYGGVTQDLEVKACAEVDAFPLIGPFIKKALGNSLSTGAQCNDNSSPVYFGPANGKQYAFIVKGTAKARMNYAPRT